MIFSYLFFRESSFAEFEYECGFATVHPRLKAAFVEWPAERVQATWIAPASKSNEASTALSAQSDQVSAVRGGVIRKDIPERRRRQHQYRFQELRPSALREGGERKERE